MVQRKEEGSFFYFFVPLFQQFLKQSIVMMEKLTRNRSFRCLGPREIRSFVAHSFSAKYVFLVLASTYATKSC